MEKQHAGCKGKTVLAIDDEVGYRDFYRFLLDSLGCRVETVGDGLEALKIVAQKPFDIIFLDIHMPKMNGYEVLKRIRQLRPEQKVAIFSSSSDFAYELEDRVKEFGILECIYKPVEIDHVIQLIASS